MNIEAQDDFQIKGYLSLSDQEQLSLRLFYGPLLNQGLAVYETLLSFPSLNRSQYSFSSLAFFSKVDVYSLDLAFSKLEEYQLIRLYESKENGYLIELIRPESPQEFLRNQWLVENLKLVLKEEYFQVLVNAFSVSSLNLKDYQEITRPSNFFHRIEKKKKKLTTVLPDNIQAYVDRAKPLIFPIQWRTTSILEALSILQMTFHFQYCDLDKLVNLATHRYDQEEQIIQYLYYLANSMEGIKKLEEIPYESAPIPYYSSLVKRPLNSIEKDNLVQIVKEMPLSNEVINTVVEWSFHQIQDLNLKYVLKVLSSVSNRKLEKRGEILSYLNATYDQPRRKEKVIPRAKYMVEVEEEKNQDFDINELKEQLEGGKY